MVYDIRLHYVVGHLSNLCADNNKSIHLDVDEIIEDVLSLELNEFSSIYAQRLKVPTTPAPQMCRGPNGR